MLDEVGVDDRIKEMVIYGVVDVGVLVVVAPTKPAVSDSYKE